MIDPILLERAADRDGLLRLLSDGLLWPIDVTSEILYEEPEIAKGVDSDGKVRVFSLVPFSDDDRRLVLLAEFDKPYVRRDLRDLLTSLRARVRERAAFDGITGFGDTIFIVAAPDYDDVRFVLFEEQGRRLPRIRSFGWRREHVGRTVLTHNLERLRWNERTTWETAWDVEGLTDTFYADFVSVFDAVKAATTHPGGANTIHAYVQQLLNRLLFIAFIERMGWLKTPEGDTDYLHAQWRRYNDRSSYAKLPDPGEITASFLGLLRELFFRALDAEKGVNVGDPLYAILGEVPYLNGGLFSMEDGLDVPGAEVRDDVFDLILGDKRPGFEGGLFRRFNFTVTESTPLDQEVAVDPEMLGKIFERLIIREERHQTGTYYTPRPIVEFMVNEALKGYLTERGLAPEKAAMLVDEDRVESTLTPDPSLASGRGEPIAFRPSELQETMDRLFAVRAVDPACGSGAYLLMLLQRLFELVDRLEIVRDKRRNPDPHHLYETKLRLLQRCVYGVDMSEIAVRIARLRMWLSLVVENRGVKPEPLPNFDFLIMRGDSLASPIKPPQGVLGYPTDAIREYTRLKRLYFHPEQGQARPTKQAMRAKRAEIAEAFESELASSALRKISADRSMNPFDWEVEFAEVFAPQDSTTTVAGRLNLGPEASRNGQAELPSDQGRAPGFDIVLANPPYVNSGELLRSVGPDYKNALVSEFSAVATGNSDLLAFFIARAVQLLATGGMLSFITSNKWLKAEYGAKLRASLASNMSVSDLMDFRDLPVFQGTIAYPLIIIAAKMVRPRFTRFVPVVSLAAPYPDVLELAAKSGQTLTTGSLGADGRWNLGYGDERQVLDAMRSSGTRLGDLVAGKMHAGIATGLNEVKVAPDGTMYQKGTRAPSGSRTEGVFIVDRATRDCIVGADPGSAATIKPLAIGRDVQKWAISDSASNRFVLYVPWECDINCYPGVRSHLSRFRQLLANRSEASRGVHPWYSLQRPRSEYANAFETEKIVYMEIGGTYGFAVSPAGQYLNNKVFLIESDSRYLLGVLNSSYAERFVRSIGAAMVGGAVAMQNPTVEQIPIPEASDIDRHAIEDAVEKILADKADNIDADVGALEAEIDRRVEFLYFHADEAANYDEWIAKQEAEKGTAVEEVRKLVAGGESGIVEFKQSLEYVDPADFAKVPDAQRSQKIAETQKAVIHSALKTICAFLNSDGGTLLLGVHDNLSIIGIEPDYSLLGRKQDRDGFENKLTDLIKTRVEPLPVGSFTVRFVEIDGKTVCRIDVQRAKAATYVDNKLYVRFGNSTEELTGRRLQDWLDGR